MGAIALGLVFAKLTESTPPPAGLTLLCTQRLSAIIWVIRPTLFYWLANVIGNVGLAVAGLGYLTPFFSFVDPLLMALAQISGYLVFYLR